MRPALLRALRRVDTLWAVAILVGMGNTLVMAVRAFGQGPALLHPGQGAASEYSGAAVFAMLAFLVPTGLGILTNGARLEVSSCPATWALPGFRLAVRRDALLLLALGCLPALVVLASLDTSHLPGRRERLERAALVTPGPGAAGFAAGIILTDPPSSGALRLGAAALVLLPVLFMEHLLLLGPLASLAALALATALLVAVLTRTTSAAEHGRLLLGGTRALPQGSRHPFAPQPWERTERRGALGDRRWSGGPDAFRSSPQRVVEFERWGWSRGTWPLGLLGPAGANLVLVLVTTLLLAQRVVLDGQGTLRLFLGLTWNPRLTHGLEVGDRDLLQMVVPGALFLVLLAIGDRMQPALRAGSLYPMSRADRASLLWRHGLASWTRALCSTALLLAAAAGAVALATGTGFGDRATTLGDGPPYWLLAALGCAVLLPLLQLGASLRELYPGEKLAPWKVLSTMIALASAFVGLLFMITLNLAELHAFERWCAVLTAPALLVAGQLAWRGYLRKKLATMDLV